MQGNFLRVLQEARRRISNTHEALVRLNDVPRPARSPDINSNMNLAIDDVYNALSQLSEPLANSYEQIKRDIQDTNRISWAGTAHEIREVLRGILDRLAPDEIVKGQAWYKQEPNTQGPTQKQKARFILEQRGLVLFLSSVVLVPSSRR